MKQLKTWLESELIGRTLRWAAFVLMLIALVTLGYRLLNSPSAGRDLQEAGAKEDSSALDAMVKQLTDHDVFNPPPNKDTIHGKFRGILGAKALFNSEWVGVGESFMDAKILAIGPDWVEYEYEGKTNREWVFGDRGASGPASAKLPAGGEQPLLPRPELAEAAAGRMQMAESPLDASLKVPPRMIERLRKMLPEQRDAFLEAMPDEMRDRVKESL